MTDQPATQTPPTAAKKEEPKRQNGGGGSGGGRGGQRRPSQPKQPPAVASPSGNQANAPSPRPTPSPRPGNRRPSGTPAGDSGSESGTRREGNNRRNEGRGGGRGGRGGGRGGNRSASGSSRPAEGRTGNGNSRDNHKASPGSAAAPPLAESSDALARLQSVIADMKGSPAVPAQNTVTAGPAPGSSAAIAAASTLPPTAAPFQPSGGMLANAAAAAQHRKAASLGLPVGLSGNFNSYSPHLGAMMEDAEDAGLEDGEIRDMQQQQMGFRQQAHQPRAQSQSFSAPRFAALAAQQQQQQQQPQEEVIGPTGRPQLAPGFSFGARRQANGAPMAPPISEEDVGFQFPQQVTPQVFDFDPSQIELPRRNEPPRPEFNGIMAEQVCFIPSFIGVNVHSAAT
jgi:protein SSD1